MSGFEIVGAVAAAGQFIEQSTKVIGLIKAIIDHVRGAPAEIAQLTEEIEALQQIAIDIKASKGPHSPTTDKVLRRCEDHVKALRKILEKISCDLDAGILKKTWQAVRGVYSEDDIRAIIDKIEREKTLLIADISVRNGYELLKLVVTSA